MASKVAASRRAGLTLSRATRVGKQRRGTTGGAVLMAVATLVASSLIAVTVFYGAEETAVSTDTSADDPVAVAAAAVEEREAPLDETSVEDVSVEDSPAEEGPLEDVIAEDVAVAVAPEATEEASGALSAGAGSDGDPSPSAGDQETASTEAGAAETDAGDTGQVDDAASGLTPGLMALRNVEPLPMPSFGAPGGPPGGPGRREAAATGNAAEQATSATAPVPSAAAPCEDIAGEERFFPLSEDSDIALEPAIAFGREVLACDDLTLRVVGYATAGENGLARAIASLQRANGVVEALATENTDPERIAASAGQGTSDDVPETDGVRIIVN
ncbi:MAG: hypothetical protein AAFN17_01915 [Pseudomonadota bacterium]